MSSYRRAVEIVPSYGPAVLGLAELQWRVGSRRAAVRTLVDFLVLDATHVDALTRLGAWLAELGRTRQAERALRRALTHAPGHGPAVRALERLGAGGG